MDKKHRLFSIFEEYRRPSSLEQSADEWMNGLVLFSNQYAYVADYAHATIKAHKGVDRCLGYDQPVFTIDDILNLNHPDETGQIMEVVARNMEWAGLIESKPFEMTFTINHRVRKANGQYIRVLRNITIWKWMMQTSNQIGELLNISVNTVNTHRRNMLARTGFSNITQLIGHLAGKGLV